MATVRDGKTGKRTGMGKSIYITTRALDLLERISTATRRSESEIVSLLVETYGPDLLTGKEPGQP